ncbi:unnamed protein product [Leuciscus chuanchicus]
MGVPLVPPHARSMELQVGLVSDIYPVKVPQEVAISRELSRLGAPYSGVMVGPWLPPHAQSMELQVGLVPNQKDSRDMTGNEVGERRGMGSGKVHEPGLELGPPERKGATCQRTDHEAIGADINNYF